MAKLRTASASAILALCAALSGGPLAAQTDSTAGPTLAIETIRSALIDRDAAVLGRAVQKMERWRASGSGVETTEIDTRSLLSEIENCQVGDATSPHFGLSRIDIACPGRATQEPCTTGNLSIVAHGHDDGYVELSLSEEMSGARDCKTRPPPVAAGAR